MNEQPARPLSDLTGTLLHHRQQLLERYEPHHLHQFRVYIRRIRAIMKYVPGLREPYLRKAWRKLFAVTSPARDWDVFQLAAADLLEPELAREFRTTLHAREEACHRPVHVMLTSERWIRHMAQWQAFIEDTTEQDWDPPSGLLPDILVQVEKARRAALKEGDRVALHRYRIAVKNLRYVTVIIDQSAQGGLELERLIESCKRAQDVLGDWHDSMLQMALIATPDFRRELAASPQAGAITQRLESALRNRRNELSARAMTLLRSGYPAWPEALESSAPV